MTSSNRTIAGEFTYEYSYGRFLLVGSNGYIITPQGLNKIGEIDWCAVAYGNGKYVATGYHFSEKKTYTTTSTDGTTWTTPIENGIVNVTPYSIIYGNGKFVIVSSDGYTSTSTNGINWTAQKRVGERNWLNVAYGNGKFVAVGYNGYISSSSDGENWSVPTQSVSNHLRTIVYGNGKFVAMGDYGTSITSTDGINWTTRQLAGNAAASWNAVTYGNGRFVAVGTSWRSISSIDGINWTDTPSNETTNFNSIGYDGNVFLAMKYKDRMTSTDGINWTHLSNISLPDFSNIEYVFPMP